MCLSELNHGESIRNPISPVFITLSNKFGYSVSNSDFIFSNFILSEFESLVYNWSKNFPKLDPLETSRSLSDLSFCDLCRSSSIKTIDLLKF